MSAGILHYRIYAQDGRFVELTCQDTPSMRKFTEWVRIHDRYTVSDRVIPSKDINARASR